MVEQGRIALLVIVAPHGGLEPRHARGIKGAQIRPPRPAGERGDQQDRDHANCQQRLAAHAAFPLAGPAGIVFDPEIRLAQSVRFSRATRKRPDR
jgi:hypothetical protein